MKTAASSAHDNAMPTTETTVRTRFFLRDRSVNEVITLIKDTALVTAIGVGELLKAAKDANNRDVNPTAFFIAAVIYLALTFLLTLLSQWCEKRFSRHERKEA